MASSVEDEAQKRNTDCVYFLASPLTCKKGSECEYRHNERARLNPRDCWYWLSGNCLNPTCAFRHPPLEGLNQPPSDLAYFQTHSIVPTSKANVPCYFYFNAFCIKGDQCPFLHAHANILPTRKLPKPSSEATCIQPQENKSDMEPSSVNATANRAEGTSWEISNQFPPKDVQMRAPTKIVNESSPSPELATLECEQHAVKLSDESLSTGDYVDARENECLGQSSDELVEDGSEPEERWESSPGFDVLVDNDSELLAYDDDTDFLLVRERESESLRCHLIQYNYEGSAEYDSADYRDPRILYDHGLYDSYIKIDDGHTTDYVCRVPEYQRERASVPIFPRRRRLLSRERGYEDGGDRRDLCDRLRKRRRIDAHKVSRSSQKRRSSHSKGSIHDRPLRHNMDRHHHWRLPSKVGKNMIGSLHSEVVCALNEDRGSQRSGYSQFAGRTLSGHWEIESRRGGRSRLPPVRPLGISKGLMGAKSARASTSGFTGPKTLTQIKEEKKTASADRNDFGNSAPRLLGKDTDNGFQGPRPLRELLKDKRRPVSEHTALTSAHSFSNGNFSDDARMHNPGTSEKLYVECESDSLDYDDDDDAFAEKLEGISIPE